MKWNELQHREADLAPLWKSKGIAWSIRSALGPALDDFVEDTTIKKNDNLARILDKLPAEQREQVDTAIGLSRTKFYDKLVNALNAERALEPAVAATPTPALFNDDYSTPMDVDENPVEQALAFLKSLQ
jgi:hypothetical protein